MSDFKKENMTDAELMELAKRRVKIKSRFLINLIAYIPFNAFIFLIWLNTSRNSHWFLWVWLGTGLFLLVHGIAVLLELNNSVMFGNVDAEYKKLKQLSGKEKTDN